MSANNNILDEIKDGFYQSRDGRLYYMRWLVEYGMEVFQHDPEAGEEAPMDAMIPFLEPVIEKLTCVGEMKYARPGSVHIQFDKV